MVEFRPTATENASAGVEPCNAPAFHYSWRKLAIIDCTAVQVMLSFEPNT